jgi:predicted membrane protein
MLIQEHRESYSVRIVRGIGYFIAILIIIWGIIVLPYGIVLIGCGIMMMWAVYKAGQKQSLKDFQKIEEESQKLELSEMKKDALKKRDDNEESF